MTLKSTRNKFLQQYEDPKLIHGVSFSHSPPIRMFVHVYDVVKAEETLPKYFDFPVEFKLAKLPDKKK